VHLIDNFRLEILEKDPSCVDGNIGIVNSETRESEAEGLR
jgi:hypothetical protein